MSQVHAIVWLDHLEATIVSFSLGSTDELEVLAHARKFFTAIDQLGLSEDTR